MKNRDIARVSLASICLWLASAGAAQAQSVRPFTVPVSSCDLSAGRASCEMRNPLDEKVFCMVSVEARAKGRDLRVEYEDRFELRPNQRKQVQVFYSLKLPARNPLVDDDIVLTDDDIEMKGSAKCVVR